MDDEPINVDHLLSQIGRRSTSFDAAPDEHPEISPFYRALCVTALTGHLVEIISQTLVNTPGLPDGLRRTVLEGIIVALGALLEIPDGR